MPLPPFAWGPESLTCPCCTPLIRGICVYIHVEDSQEHKLAGHSVHPLAFWEGQPPAPGVFSIPLLLPWSEAGVEQVLPVSILASLSPSIE